MSEENDTEEPKEEAAKDNKLGKVEWMDLTVDNATAVSEFYSAVVGWSSEGVSMGSYDDFNMNLPGSNNTVAGVCHARGSNANLPAQWLMYVRVASVAESTATCERKGGKVLDGPRRMGGSQFAVIQDPAGAVMAIVSD